MLNAFPAAAEALEFPCDYEIKVMASTELDVAELTLSLLREAGAEVRADSLRLRDSSGGRYRSVSVTVFAPSREDLIHYYGALRAHPAVRWLL